MITMPQTIRYAAEAPCHVPFRPELPVELATMQDRLGTLMDEIKRRCRDGGNGEIAAALGALDRTMAQYLIDEGVQFEPYMRIALEGDLETLQLMRRLRARLRELARELHEVADLGARGHGARARMIVADAMERIGGELALCLEHQRTLLFPLYRPLARALPG